MRPDPNSANLDQIKSVLAKSFDAESGEDAPPLPESLRDRITDQYGRSAESVATTKEGFSAMLSRWFAQPAFAGATVAVLLLLAAVVFLQGPNDPNTFRGGTTQVDTATIVLYQVDDATMQTLRESGYFDEKAMRRAQTSEELEAIAPPKIILDGNTGTIISLGAEGADPVTTKAPSDPADLPEVLVELLRSL